MSSLPVATSAGTNGSGYEPSTSPLIPQPPTLVGRSAFRGLVRSPVPFSERHDEGNTTQALPGVRCIFFVSQLLVHVATYGSNANTHGVSLDKSVRLPSRLLG
jgi:hypothetical protein